MAGKLTARPAPDRRVMPPWQKTHGTYLAGKAALDDVDLTASALEQKWGVGRLRLLVSAELREKFDRQRYLLNQAIWHGELIEVQTQAKRMITAWQVLDAKATAAGAVQLEPDVWEVLLDNGSVAALVRDNISARYVHNRGDRAIHVYTLTEIGRLLSAFPTLATIKTTWKGATVMAVRQTHDEDPLEKIHDTKTPLEQELDDEIPF